MFLKKSVLFVLVIGFFVGVFMPSFAEEAKPEPTQTDTGIIEESPDEKVKVIPASYQAVRLVREFGMRMFGQASQIAFSPDNKVIYVADPSNFSILAFDSQGDLIFSFGSLVLEYRAKPGLNAVQEAAERDAYDEENKYKFSSVMNIGTDLKGNIYVADYNNNVVKMFTSEGEFVLKLSVQAGPQKKILGKGASGVAINSRGDIYITDNANGAVQVNDLNGKYKYQITKFKDKTGKEISLVTPSHPRINSVDELYVVDPLICRVHRFNAKGGYMGSFGYMGDGAGGFNAPNGLAIDKLDRLYVTDKGFGVIQVFSRQGKFLYALCDEKGGRLEIPFVSGISVDSDNLIYVSVNDDKGYHVKVFEYSTKTTK